jgi:hypothetical protein
MLGFLEGILRNPPMPTVRDPFIPFRRYDSQQSTSVFELFQTSTGHRRAPHHTLT